MNVIIVTITVSQSDSQTQVNETTTGEDKLYRTKNKIRFITAASLFDGHDAAINIMRRLLQDTGCEVIHLGHNRSVADIIKTAIEEDAQGIAVSSYQGGHIEFFKYMYDLLHENKATQHIKIFGGGGGVIVPSEIKELEDYGIAKIFSPEDGSVMGLQGMINYMCKQTDFNPMELEDRIHLRTITVPDDHILISQYLSALENGHGPQKEQIYQTIKKSPLLLQRKPFPIIGITGTGGAGKSSLVDELVLRFLHDFPDLRIAVLSVDPSKKKSGGALLGDRIRMNSVSNAHVFMRSFATRGSNSEIAESIPDAIQVMKAVGNDLILVETSGIGQGDSAIVSIADLSIYVMTPEYGAATQLEKIEMLDYADIVVLNKFDRRGAEDGLRAVRKQFRRAHGIGYNISDTDLPVFPTIASHFNDTGVNIFYLYLLNYLNKHLKEPLVSKISISKEHELKLTESFSYIIPPARTRYLSEIADTIRKYKTMVEKQATIIQQISSVENTLHLLRNKDRVGSLPDTSIKTLEKIQSDLEKELTPETKTILQEWPKIHESYKKQTFSYQVRDHEVTVPIVTQTLSGTLVPKVALPKFKEPSDIFRFLMLEHLPGYFPYTAGVYPFKRTEEDPRRQFAGEGPPVRTNTRFHYLTRNDTAKRLSTAFDSVTLYGQDPDHRPDIFGKIGESGVSICCLDDLKILYDGFDLCSPTTSVSMTINGPAPILLAFFFNTAIDQQITKFKDENKRDPVPDELAKIHKYTLETVRGTVQADILKEDQAQNTCIFSIEIALKMMGDIQEYFIQHNVKNYYSVSISGYHIAEAGANPITQLAFTLANGFTFVEYYLSRGMNIDDFAPNLSFFFSNGLDAEYTVIGRVARRIWAIAMRELYHADNRSQKLKYHIQTSGRSLHAQEVDFNDIRTTLQALMAYYDNCNSLHTNAYDEAITTPTEESVRRAMAIQLIIAKELGWAKNENPLQGSFIIEELTDLVEEAVLTEFDHLTDRGGVLGAMELGYQRYTIQDESLYYERLKHSAKLPIIGVNTFLREDHVEEENKPLQLVRATYEEKEGQIKQKITVQEQNKDLAPEMLARLKQVAISGGNIFAELMNTVRYATLGQITQALFEVGGAYRRGM